MSNFENLGLSETRATSWERTAEFSRFEELLATISVTLWCSPNLLTKTYTQPGAVQASLDPYLSVWFQEDIGVPVQRAVEKLRKSRTQPKQPGGYRKIL